MRLPKITKNFEIGYFAPFTWQFWRALIICFCVLNIVGHWLEIPYCLAMDALFDIVADDYDVWTDPWYHPYWVYGSGAAVMTFLIEPFKEHMSARRKALWGAVLESFVYAVILSMLLELIIGWMVNQPDELGVYPYWDNSQLPLNIFGQAWLVNDIFIGLVAMLYVWLIFPFTCDGLSKLRPTIANGIFGFVVGGFIACCLLAYIPWH